MKLMGLERQFIEPHEYWDSYCEKREEQYEHDIEGKTCLDCADCVGCTIAGHENVGYCPEIDEFVSDEHEIGELGIDCFKAA